MPCYEPPDAYSRSDNGSSRSETEMLHHRIGVLTDLLCQAGRAYCGRESVPPAVMEWWMEHAKCDWKRGKPWKGVL